MSIDFTTLFLQLPALGIVVWLVHRLVVAQQEHLKAEADARDRMLQRHHEERMQRDKEWREWLKQMIEGQENRCKLWFETYINNVQEEMRAQSITELAKMDRITEELRDMRKLEDVMAKSLLEMTTLVKANIKENNQGPKE